MRLLIAVTHLLGTGHLSRALALAEAFTARGWSVDVVSGGRPAPHLGAGGATLHQLPPLASDGADFISFFLHNPAAIKVLGVERGVPASAKARQIVKPTLKDYDAAQIDFFDKYSGMTRAKTVLDPTGAGDVGTALTNATQSVALGKSSVADAVDKFWSDANKALAS